MNAVPTQAPPQLAPLTTDTDRAAFRALNEAWISGLFALEEADRAALADPDGHYVAPGGAVFMAHLGGRPVGCVALRPEGAGVFEVSKMAVDPAAQGRGVGRRLLAHAVAQAREMGATRLVLASNARLGPAVHLYESLGFRHLAPHERPHTPYSRADVFMELALS
ncbi:GNAT family N-acetyltransferase [Deinococcus sp. Leaf326]|uniref:GNAT family N-acetyltransferase n=1 Tax=Deinococcus sp. Leaf326 TaxID=1736338 RepID=UPI0006F73616|nr:GNAT family N-acetyltransferase [Deinococcus sp. Leaf326]KQR04737.1 acetyltransferase [Deinococcus sp. Leaf326]